MSVYPSWQSIIIVVTIVGLGLFIWLKQEGIIKKKREKEKENGN